MNFEQGKYHEQYLFFKAQESLFLKGNLFFFTLLKQRIFLLKLRDFH